MLPPLGGVGVVEGGVDLELRSFCASAFWLLNML